VDRLNNSPLPTQEQLEEQRRLLRDAEERIAGLTQQLEMKIDPKMIPANMHRPEFLDALANMSRRLTSWNVMYDCTISSLQADLKSANKDIERLTHDLKAAQTARDDYSGQLADNFDNHFVDTRQRLANLETAIEQNKTSELEYRGVSNELAALKQRFENLKDEHSELQRDLESMENDLENVRDEATTAASKANIELSRLRAELEKAQNKQTFEKELNELQQVQARLDAELKQVTTERDGLKSQLATLKTQLQTRNGEMDSLNRDLRAKDSNIMELNTKLSSTNTDLENAKADLVNATSDLTNVRSQLTQQSHSHTQSQEELQKTHEESHKRLQQAHDQALQGKDAEISTRDKQIESLKSQNQRLEHELQQRVQALEAQLREKSSLVDTLESTNATLQSDLSTKTTECSDLRNENSASNSRLANVKTLLKHPDTKLGELKDLRLDDADLAGLRELRFRAWKDQNDLDAARIEAKAHKEKLASVNTELRDWKATVQLRDTEIQNRKAELHELTQQSSFRETTLQNELDKKVAEVAVAHNSLQAVQQNAKYYEGRCNELSTQLNNAKVNLNNVWIQAEANENNLKIRQQQLEKRLSGLEVENGTLTKDNANLRTQVGIAGLRFEHAEHSWSEEAAKHRETQQGLTASSSRETKLDQQYKKLVADAAESAQQVSTLQQRVRGLEKQLFAEQQKSKDILWSGERAIQISCNATLVADGLNANDYTTWAPLAEKIAKEYEKQWVSETYTSMHYERLENTATLEVPKFHRGLRDVKARMDGEVARLQKKIDFYEQLLES
jgi:chromosome segregation ATPase